MPRARLQRPSRGVATLVLAILVSLFAAVAAGDAGRSTASINSVAGCPATTLSSGDHTLGLRSAGRSRPVLVHVPSRRAAGPRALVVVFHGAGSNGPAMAAYSGFSKLADEQGFIVAYPSAARPRRVWTLVERSEADPDDVAMSRALLDLVRSRTCIDARRVSAVGVSNGGGMVARLGCELSDRLAAIVVVAGGFSTLPECRPSRAVSVLEIHGTRDPVVPYGGLGGRGSVPGWLAGWRNRNGCPAVARQDVSAARVRRLAWGPCRDGSVVAHLRIFGGRHQYPGATPPDRGPASTISATSTAWRFINARRLAPDPR